MPGDDAADDLVDALDGLNIDDSQGTSGDRRRPRRRRPAPLPGKNSVSSPAVALDGTPPPKVPIKYIAPRREWSELPDWIVLENQRGSQKQGKPYPPLNEDPLFRDEGAACLLPFMAASGNVLGRGAAIVCPGGNYEFLAPYEGPPIAAWLSESLGIPAYVLRYRLLPEYGLDEMQADLADAVREARRHAHGGPVLAIGFSAGCHLIASGVATSGAAAAAAADADAAAVALSGCPDAQALIYPSINPDSYLVDEECGFWRAECDSPQVGPHL